MSHTQRTCPSCQKELQRKVSHHVEIDVCDGCGGMWMDHGEFDALVARRFTGHESERDMAAHTFVKPNAVLRCPVDGGPMVGVAFEDLDLEFCPKCRGIWIDGHDHQVIDERADEHPFDESQVKLPRQSGLDYPVTCSGCGAEVVERTTVHVGQKYFCENCVVSGDFPELEAQVALMVQGKRVRPNRERHELLHGTSAHLPSAVESAVAYIKHIFE